MAHLRWVWVAGPVVVPTGAVANGIGASGPPEIRWWIERNEGNPSSSCRNKRNMRDKRNKRTMRTKGALYGLNFVTNQKLVLTIELTMLDGPVSYLLRYYKRRSISPALVAQHSVRRIVVLYLLGFGIEIQRSPQAVRGVCQVG